MSNPSARPGRDSSSNVIGSAGNGGCGSGTPLTLLGIDIGGTKRVLAVGDHTSRIFARARHPMRFSGDWRRDLAGVIEEARGLLREASERGGAGRDPLEAIGVATPGPVDLASGILRNPPNLPGWRDVPLVEVLADAFRVPVYIENDANAAALAEHRFGAGLGARDLIYLTMSTGVGGGVICGGQLIRGARGFAGELGHIPVVPSGLRCHCGLRGCLEAYVGGQAWAKRLRRVARPTGRLIELAGGQRSKIGPEVLLLAAREGDAFARAELARWLDHLASGLVPLVMAFDPECIVLGTIAVAAGEALCFEPLRQRVSTRLWPHQAERLRIVPASLGDALPEQAALAVAGAVGQAGATVAAGS